MKSSFNDPISDEASEFDGDKLTKEGLQNKLLKILVNNKHFVRLSNSSETNALTLKFIFSPTNQRR